MLTSFACCPVNPFSWAAATCFPEAELCSRELNKNISSKHFTPLWKRCEFEQRLLQRTLCKTETSWTTMPRSEGKTAPTWCHLVFESTNMLQYSTKEHKAVEKEQAEGLYFFLMTMIRILNVFYSGYFSCRGQTRRPPQLHPSTRASKPNKTLTKRHKYAQRREKAQPHSR